MFGHDDHKPDENHDNNEHKDEVKPADALATDDNWQHPGPPPADNDDSNDSQNDPQDDHAAPVGFSMNHDDTPAVTPSHSDNDLIDLKQEALTKLSPLVSHLDQSPAEKFRTLMMMIQASDDQKLVREAYETALKISDEKERAQALLDIVNEINYFTHGSGTKE